tara:strand:+ start:156 stop:320 length:165 start_codon:yes stop_codon:yes gene_type:complete
MISMTYSREKKMKKLEKRFVYYQALSNKKSIKKTLIISLESSTYSNPDLTYITR